MAAAKVSVTMNEKLNLPNHPRRRSLHLLAVKMAKLFSSSVNLSDAPSEPWEPNKYAKDLIVCTWSNELDDLYQVGSEIYESIFETVPDAKTLFHGSKKTGENWKEDREFRRQVLRFVQVISDTVRNLHDLESFRLSTLYNIGRAHCKFAERGFRPQYWDGFQTAIKKTMKNRVARMSQLSEKQKEDVITSWFFLAEQIIEGMRKGYDDGMKAGKRKLSF